MKLEKLFVSILAAAALFVGCKDTGEDSELPVLSVNPTEVSVDKAGGSQTFTVKSNRDWTVKADADWLAVNPTSGNASKKETTITVTALQNTGFNRTGTVTVSTEFDYKTVTVTQLGDKGEDTTDKPTGSGTQADPYNAAGVIAYIQTLGSGESPSAVWVKGIISEVRMTFEASGSYGNANFYISGDGTTTAANQFYCFQTYYLGNKQWTSGNPDIKVGDEVIVCGKVVNYNGNTPETVGKGASYIYSLNGVTEGKQEDYTSAEAKTVAQFIAAADGSKYYKLTGKVSGFNATYCSFNLTDDSGTIYVYSVDNKDEWSSKIKDGGTVTLAGKYEYYEKKEQHEVVHAMILSFEEGQGGGDDYQNAEAKTVAQFIAAADKDKYYKLTGTVSGFNATYCSFDLTDDSGSIYVYSVDNKDEWSSKIKNGGTVTLAGKYEYYEKKEQHEVVHAMILSFDEGQGGGDAKEATVAQAIAAEKDAVLKVGPALVIASSQAGFLMEQDGARLYVYGSTAKVGDNVTVTGTRGEYSGVAQLTNVTAVTTNSTGNTVSHPSPKDITSTFDSYSSDTREYVTFKGTLSISSGKYYNIAVEGASTYTGALVKPDADVSSFDGKVVTVTGYYLYIASSKYLYVIATEIKDEGGQTPPGPGGDEDYSSNVTWTNVSSAYDDGVATVNGVANVKVYKLGTSSKVGTANVVIPKGTKSVSFYGVSWKGNPATVVVKMGDSEIYSQALAANDGATSNSPYTITVTDSDHYTMTLPSQLTEDVSVTVTTSEGGKTRVILFGIKAQ